MTSPDRCSRLVPGLEIDYNVASAQDTCQDLLLGEVGGCPAGLGQQIASLPGEERNDAVPARTGCDVDGRGDVRLATGASAGRGQPSGDAGRGWGRRHGAVARGSDAD